jgi:hypothetical protein
VDHATEAGCATLQLEGDNDEKSCRDADSLTRCCRGKGHGHLGGGDGGGGSSVLWCWGSGSERRWWGRSSSQVRVRVLPCGSVGGGPPGEERERER